MGEGEHNRVAREYRFGDCRVVLPSREIWCGDDVVVAKGSQFPSFDAIRFIDASAYTDAGYRDALAKPLFSVIESTNR